MAHIALYRSWRPQSFADMVGQEHIVRTLQNSLREGRLSHAYLFSGPRGTGKTSAAKILAKAVNCEKGPAEEPCNECASCRRITEGSVIDVVEIDAASNRGVDEIRDLRDKVKYAPTEVRQKVYIIDEVHMLTTEAFNALLKTLEEPPGHVMFILATTEPHRLPATIISRCQRFEFRRVQLREQVERLRRVCAEEGFEVETQALEYIARLSDGGMRDALSLLDQIASFSGQNITYETAVSMTGGIAMEQFGRLAQAVKDKDIGAALEIVGEFMQSGKSADKCMESLIHYFRDLLMVKMVPDSEAVTSRIVDSASFRELAQDFRQDDVFQIIDVLNKYQTEMKYSSQPQTLFEVALMKACCSDAAEPSGQPPAADRSPGNGHSAADSGELDRLKQKVSQLEQQLNKLLESGAPGSQPASGGRRESASASSRTPSASAMPKSNVKLNGFLRAQDSDLFKQAVQKWSQVLAHVKERKITVHAWLIDGEPVSFDEDTVLLAFKSGMHRDTTERPANKQLIEQVMAEVFGHPTRLATVMMNQWKDARKADTAESAPEVMQLEPEDPSAPKEEWVEEAIRLFGEDLVKIKDE